VTWLDVAHALRQIRVDAGKSQAEIAEAAGVSQGVVSRIESGRETSWDVITSWAEACGREVRIEFPPKGTAPGRAIPKRLEPFIVMLAQVPEPMLPATRALVGALLVAAGQAKAASKPEEERDPDPVIAELDDTIRRLEQKPAGDYQPLPDELRLQGDQILEEFAKLEAEVEDWRREGIPGLGIDPGVEDRLGEPIRFPYDAVEGAKRELHKLDGELRVALKKKPSAAEGKLAKMRMELGRIKERIAREVEAAFPDDDIPF